MEELAEGLFEKRIMFETRSLCPYCDYTDGIKTLNAQVFEENGMVMIKKVCPVHKEEKEVVWSSKEMWDRVERYKKSGRGIENPFVTKENPECPDACGLCIMHKSHPALTNLVLTNRCDENCWYCFDYSEKAGYVYEPNLEQIRFMARTVKNVRPIPGNAVQLTGGEPTLRDDLEEIVRVIKEEGIEHVQLNTHGRNLYLKPGLAKKLRRAGVNTIYLSFDGVTPKTNLKNYYEIPGIMESCNEAGLGVVLVPTVINTINDHEVGAIVRFGQKYMNRPVNGEIFQPISFTGRMEEKEREKDRRERQKFRITIPDVIERIEEQTDGEIGRNDFFPVPAVGTISDFVGDLFGKRYELTSHFACGMATYVFKEGDKLIPLSRFVDVDGVLEYMKEKDKEINDGKSKTQVKLEFGSHLILGKAGELVGIESFVDKQKIPEGLNIRKLLLNVVFNPGYDALSEFHKNSMLIGMMHFQDKFNYMTDRTENCCIDYAMPNGALIPFCAFNVIPERYRDSLQRKYGMPLEKWKARNPGKTMSLYRRSEELKAQIPPRLV